MEWQWDPLVNFPAPAQHITRTYMPRRSETRRCTVQQLFRQHSAKDLICPARNCQHPSLQVPERTGSLTSVPEVIVQVDIIRGNVHIREFQKLLRRFTQVGLLETVRQTISCIQSAQNGGTDRNQERETRPVSCPGSRDLERLSSFLVYL